MAFLYVACQRACWYSFLDLFEKVTIMKTSRSQNTKQNKQYISHIPKPELRDNLDSRKVEEQDSMGDNMTNNKKYQRNNKQRKSDRNA